MNPSTSTHGWWVALVHRPAMVVATLALGAATLDAQTTYYVSPTGKDANAGTTLAAPFRTVQRGIDALQAPGDVLVLRGGDYAGAVKIVGKHGAPGQPIVIRSYQGERARIDGYLPLQPSPGIVKPLWEPASKYDAGAHPE